MKMKLKLKAQPRAQSKKLRAKIFILTPFCPRPRSVKLFNPLFN